MVWITGCKSWKLKSKKLGLVLRIKDNNLQSHIDVCYKYPVHIPIIKHRRVKMEVLTVQGGKYFKYAHQQITTSMVII